MARCPTPSTALAAGGSSSGSAPTCVADGPSARLLALGTDTAGSGRVPAGLNNIVGLKPSKGLLSTHGVVPAAKSVDCVSIFAPTVALAVRVLQSAMGFDAKDACSRDLRLTQRTPSFPAAFSFGVPSTLAFFGDALAEEAFGEAIERLESLGGTRVAIDYAPLAEAASLLYDSALVAERYAAVRDFFDVHEDDVIEPVRSILASGRKYSAADLFDAQLRLQTLAQRVAPMWRTIDMLVVPTAPRHCTIDEMRAEPVVRNRELGAYTNFVNLLDYAALSVPSSIRPDGLPFGITLIGPCSSDLQLAELGQRFHHATGLTLGATGRPMPPPVDPDLGGADTVRVAVVGAHLSGMPLNGQLRERGARLLVETDTAPDYRLYALPANVPPKPGMLRVAPGTGAPIRLEIWEMPAAHYGTFVALIPAPLGIGTVTLADGSSVQGFVCEALALDGAEDITRHGGWRRYIASRQAPAG